MPPKKPAKLRPHPTLPASAFVPPSASPTSSSFNTVRRAHPLSIIDSHVHVWHPSQIQSSISRIRDDPKVSKSVLNADLSFDTFQSVTVGFADSVKEKEGSQGRKWALSASSAKRESDAAAGEGGGKEDEDLGQKMLRGFLYVQIEVDHDDSDVDGSKGGWDASIAEIDFLCKSVTSSSSAQTPLLGLIPWAPLPHGRLALDSYHSKLLSLPSLLTLSTTNSNTLTPQTSSSTPSPIKGFRYLLQDVEPGTMLKDGFIDGLKWMGEKGFVASITVDSNGVRRGNKFQRGPEVLEEVMECLKKVREGQEEGGRTKVVLEHFAKADISNPPLRLTPSHPISQLISNLFEIALVEDVYLKLSGCLSETDPAVTVAAFKEYLAHQQISASSSSSSTTTSGSSLQEPPHSNLDRSASTSDMAVPVQTDDVEQESEQSSKYGFAQGGVNAIVEVKKSIKLILEPALEAFGDSRILVGSDWPVYREFLFYNEETNKEGVKEIGDEKIERAAWEFEMCLYREALVELGVEGDALDRIFGENARRVYGLA